MSSDLMRASSITRTSFSGCFLTVRVCELPGDSEILRFVDNILNSRSVKQQEHTPDKLRFRTRCEVDEQTNTHKRRGNFRVAMVMLQ